MVAVVGGMRIPLVLGTALEDDVDDVALQGHLGVIVEGGAVEPLHIGQLAPRGLFPDQGRHVLRGDGFAAVAGGRYIDVAPMHVVVPVHVVAQYGPLAA